MRRRPSDAREGEHPAETRDWPQLEGASALATERAAPIPLLPPADAAAQTADAAQETELLERIAAFRGAVSDKFYEISKDYQMLCKLEQAHLTSCGEIAGQLRRRLAGNTHYEVLAKLDEVMAFVASRAGAPSPR